MTSLVITADEVSKSEYMFVEDRTCGAEDTYIVV